MHITTSCELCLKYFLLKFYQPQNESFRGYNPRNREQCQRDQQKTSLCRKTSVHQCALGMIERIKWSKTIEEAYFVLPSDVLITLSVCCISVIFSHYIDNIWHYPWNLKYIRYCIVIREWPNQGHREHEQNLNMWFSRYVSIRWLKHFTPTWRQSKENWLRNQSMQQVVCSLRPTCCRSTTWIMM